MAVLEHAIVRILNSNGIPVGTGFLVASGRVLTCAHVVTAALGRASVEMPAETIALDFPLIAPKQVGQAHVVVWLPQTDLGGDIAGLELLTPVPDGAQAVRLVEAEKVWGHSFRAYGFHLEAGGWATGRLLGTTANQWVQIEDVKTTGYAIQPGFSGGAVWDEEVDGVAGMIVAAVRQKEVKTAFMIPARQLIATWPELGAFAIPPNPYRGLLAFKEEHAPFFFGQKAFTDRLVEAVRKPFVAQPLVAVIGPSGSGKSSVVLAGLVPRLRAERVDGGNWLVVDFRPGERPFQALAAALIPHLEPQKDEVERRDVKTRLAAALQNDPTALADFAKTIVQKTPSVSRLLLVIDQFEELYTLTPFDSAQGRPEIEQTPFLDALLNASQTQPDQPFTILLTLRADFVSRALTHRRFADALQEAAQMLGPMTRPELEEAISKPAETQGVKFQPGLVQRILDDVENETGGLPLLEFALAQLWERQEHGELTHKTYEAIGGVSGALTGYATQEFNRLTEAEKARVPRVLVQMVQPGEGAEDTRRVARREDLPAEDWAVACKLADRRLLVTDRDPTTEEETVEVAHEALIRGWDLLKGWMQADRAFRTWQERLRAAIRQWEANGRDEGGLLRGVPLAEAEDWLGKRGKDLGERELEFMQTSLELQKREQAARERQRRTSFGIAVGVASIMTILVIFLFVLWQKTSDALTALNSKLLDSIGSIEFEENPLLGLQLVLEKLNTLQGDTDIQNSTEQTLRTMAEEGRLVWIGSNIDYLYSIPDSPYFAVDSDEFTYKTSDELHRTDINEVIQLNGDVSNIYPFLNSPFFIVIYTNAPGELRRTDTEKDIKLIGNMDRVSPVPNSPFFVAFYSNAPGELRRTDIDEVVQLSGIVDWISPIPNSPFFIVVYSNGSRELRRTDTGEIVQLNGNLFSIFPISHSPFFVVGYSNFNTPNELRRADTGTVVQKFEGDVFSVYSIPDSPYFVVNYSDFYVSDELRRTDSSEVIQLPEQISYVSPIPDSPFFVAVYSNSHDELRRTDTNEVITLTGDITDVFPFPDSPYFILAYSDAPGELHRIDTNEVILLTGVVESVLFLPGTNFYLVNYSDIYDELRQFITNEIILLNGHITHIFFLPDSYFFVVGYLDGRYELWREDIRILQMGLGVNDYFLSGENRLVVLYTDGRAYLLDLDWLTAMGGQAETMPLDELIDILCQGPLASEWVDDEALRAYLGGEEPQGCK